MKEKILKSPHCPCHVFIYCYYYICFHNCPCTNIGKMMIVHFTTFDNQYHVF